MARKNLSDAWPNVSPRPLELTIIILFNIFPGLAHNLELSKHAKYIQNVIGKSKPMMAITMNPWMPIHSSRA
jgi:hypothetical protein